jgi:hypothetical protein
MTTGTITDAGLTSRLVAPRPRLDPRSHVATPECVDIALAGTVAAARYVAPVTLACRVPRAALRQAGDAGATAVSELLWGEAFELFDVAGDWGFGRSAHDRYTGWIAMAALGDAPDAASLPVTARLAPVFAAADIKAPVRAELPFGARVAGVPAGAFLALATGGFVHQRHLAPLPLLTPLAVARGFAGAPYLWGGRTPDGVDCSGLVQAALMACGIACPRDSDQQRAALGSEVAFADRRGGDIIFFPGHVGLLVDADTLLHANAHWMATVEEPLADVVARGVEVLAVRRLG